MSKRGPGGMMGSLLSKKSKLDEKTAQPKSANSNKLRNPFLARPVNPEAAVKIFLAQARNEARRYNKDARPPFSKPFCEVEARIGILKVNSTTKHGIFALFIFPIGIKHN